MSDTLVINGEVVETITAPSNETTQNPGAPVESLTELSTETLGVVRSEVESLTELATETVEVVSREVEFLTELEPGPRGATGPQGAPGVDGESFTWRGSWWPTPTYAPNDVVVYVGSSYIALRATTNEYPDQVPAAWQLVAQRGADGAGDKNYRHVQTMAATQWTVNHNLGKHPAVNVVDSGGNEVEGTVDYLDENTLIVSFAVPFSGTVYCN